MNKIATDFLNDQDFFENGTLFTTERGKVLLGKGKRLWMKKAIDTEPCYYFPDFFLQDDMPWCTHEKWEEIHIDELDIQHQKLSWTIPYRDLFVDIIKNTLEWIQHKGLKKAVPYLFTESQAKWDLKSAIRSALNHSRKYRSYCYGFWENGCGILGVTPEILFKQNSNVLSTMAVAGTWKKSQEMVSEAAKLDEEHAIVVEDLLEKLKLWGSVKTSERRVIQQGALNHWQTPIEVGLKGILAFEDVVKILHPTPALGAYPYEIGKKWLLDYEKNIPRMRYGAPAGYKMGNKAQCFVAIRNIQWDKTSVRIGAGCGIVNASDPNKEWDELCAKMELIKEIVGL